MSIRSDNNNYNNHDVAVHQPYPYCTDGSMALLTTPPQLLVPDMYSSVHTNQAIHLPPHASLERIDQTSILSHSVITPQSISPVESHAPTFPRSGSYYEEGVVKFERSEITAPSSVVAGQSPRLVDLLLPGTDHRAPLGEYQDFRNQYEAFYQPTGLTPPADLADDIEEIPRNWNYLPSPVSSNSSAESTDRQIPPQIQIKLCSPEDITGRFDRDTCGVLSVKDGPTENPWRTLVWPLAHNCPALYHAIASLTSFHQSAQFPPMRIQGIDHMHTAVHALATGLQDMRFDAAISTTLVLAFAESWDIHIRTGIDHIKGAKVLINQALIQHRHTPRQGKEWMRLKFLCNTWIYMDVIARLTSADDDESNDVDAIYDSIYPTGEREASLDPLMGCAHSLFPIIGRIANLVRKLRKSTQDCSDLVAQAIGLKRQLEEWTPPSHIENPEDQTTSPRDSIKTARAYQYATLLYLHQAFPSIPSMPALVLAKRVLCELGAVEPSSRTSIVHIYPLMAAGCEVISQEERAWVEKRWRLLSSRMRLGIIDKSLTVTKEVWDRRDAYSARCDTLETTQMGSTRRTDPRKRSFDRHLESQDDDACWLESPPKRATPHLNIQRQNSISELFEQERRRHDILSEDAFELLDPEFTVTGRLHWLGVMRDWKWEGKHSQQLSTCPPTNCYSTTWLNFFDKSSILKGT